ncbi:MAG: amidohydrolase [Gemmatimonadota bacterium]|uniref:amidohydrolase n=1 Tax=Candidatus Palauibacter scopulicola TaxID=3056741 RepID=UPI00238C4508|nr:amidohydrolase [Candidatus Palauibacter scopulicola]MDE2662460.1 amidohydrolase [Candidatus Palauibacter scopulicola]
MSEVNRREFMALSGLAAGGAALAGCGTPGGGGRQAGDGAAHHADQVVTNATVYTVDDANPRAEALAVRNGRFLAAGSNDDIANLIGPRTERIDAGGGTVVPGFIDAHNHPSSAGMRHLTEVDMNIRTIEGMKSALRERAQNTPPGEWVVGFLYDDTKIEEGRPLNRRDIDEAVPDHPVQVTHRGGHTSVYNSKAFELAGITVDTPDPTGGHFYREDGELTGKVASLARRPLQRLVPGGSTREDRQAGVALIGQLMSAAGITSVHETGGNSQGLTALQDAYDAGDLRFRMYYFPSGGSLLFSALKQAGVRTGFGDENLRIGAVKYSADGSASERTMAMRTPYVGRPDDYGISTMTQEDIDRAVDDAVRAGFQIAIHANGDKTIDMCLNAYERVQREIPQADPRFRLEHCSLVDDPLLQRIKDVGAIPTPFYTYIHFHGNKWGEYGAEKMEWMFAHRRFLDYDIPVAGASDYPPGPFEALMAIQSMVTRTDMQGREWGPSQRISVPEALRICTINGAHASFEEHIKGSITGGKLADYVILGDDPHTADPYAIKEIEVVRTVVGGRTTHEA